MILAAVASLLLLLLPLLLPQGAVDPEAQPAGRAQFLGREVAQTMHWTGASWLLRATREDEENGALLRRWLEVQPGQSVCDLGCGNGYHTLPLAVAVGATGTVYAVEVQPEMLQLLAQRADRQHLANVKMVEGAVDDPKLPAASCDLVLLVDVYHELTHPVRVLQHVRAALKLGGRVVLVEFRAEDPGVPIKPEHKMTKAQVVREMAAHGFELAAQFDGLPWQHALAFTAAPDDARLAPRQLLRAFAAARAAGDARIVAPFVAADADATALPPLPGSARIELRAGSDGRVLAALANADGSLLGGARDEAVLGVDGAGRWCVEALRARTPMRGFYAMHTGTGGGAADAQAALVRELGFDGIAGDLEHTAELRHACEARGGDLVSSYAVLDVARAAASGVNEGLAPLRAGLQALAGGPGMLWLALQQTGRAPRDAAGDDAAVAVLGELLRAADATGVEIALYPHQGCWLETTEDALRLCERVRHPRLGLCFNLCHFLRTSGDADPAPLLQRCGARLFAVTLNGADSHGTEWPTLIRPLGAGDFEVGTLLCTLDAVGFAGPIALQGFGLSAPPREHLAQSMAAWQRLQVARAAKK